MLIIPNTFSCQTEFLFRLFWNDRKGKKQGFKWKAMGYPSETLCLKILLLLGNVTKSILVHTYFVSSAIVLVSDRRTMYFHSRSLPIFEMWKSLFYVSFHPSQFSSDLIHMRSLEILFSLNEEIEDQYQYLGNYPPTPPLTQQQSIDNKLGLMLD